MKPRLAIREVNGAKTVWLFTNIDGRWHPFSRATVLDSGGRAKVWDRAAEMCAEYHGKYRSQ